MIYPDHETTQDPAARDARARTDRWAFRRAHEERIAAVVKVYGDNSQQQRDAVSDELLEYRADSDVYAPYTGEDGGQ